MKIGELASATNVSVDTLRYYEKQRLLEPPTRTDNGYRSFGESHVARVQFIRSAQALGFSLAQIVEIIPRLAAGKFGRREIEQQLSEKLAEVDGQIEKLQLVKTNLLNTFNALTCDPGLPVSSAAVTLKQPGARVRIKGLHAK